MSESLTSLLDQMNSSHSSAPETLADTLRKHAKDLTDTDLTMLVSGLREQRERWNLSQAQRSKERVTSKKVVVKKGGAAPMGFTIKKVIV
jgi:hypothetical protein